MENQFRRHSPSLQKSKRNSSGRWIFVIILFAYVVYAGFYIYQSSIVIDGQRYFVLFDDAMISMRYARNLARGEGLVWNPGERVEGFSNPLWVLLMAVVHLFPIPTDLISLPMQIIGGLFLIGSLFFVKRIGEDLSGSAGVGLLAVFITAFYAQLSTWSLLGMEVSAAILITTLAAWIAIRMLRGEIYFSKWLYVLLGAGTLLRFDMLVQYLAIWSFLAWADHANRRRHMLWGAGMLAAFLGGQTILRYLYFGDFLPNTYYLKVGGISTLFLVKAGLSAFFRFVWGFNPVFFWFPLAIAIGVSLQALSKQAEKRLKGASLRDKLLPIGQSDLVPAFLAWVFLAGCAYSIFVGGDAWEEKGGANRFISTGIPLLFLLIAYVPDWWGKQNRTNRDTLLGFGMLALVSYALLDLRYVAKVNDLLYSEIGNAGFLLLAVLTVIGLTFPHRKNITLMTGLVVFWLYFILVGVIRRHELAGDILPGQGGITTLDSLFNFAKVAIKLFVGQNALLFDLPLVLIGMLVFPWGTGSKAQLVGRLGPWLVWVMFLLALAFRLPNPDAWVQPGGFARSMTAYLLVGLLLLAEMGPGDNIRRFGHWLEKLGSLAWETCLVVLILTSTNTVTDYEQFEYWTLIKRHPFIPGSERYLRISLAIDRIMKPDATVAVVTAGIIPYFTDRPAIDLLGKSDRVIARTPMHVTADMPLGDYRPGHMKWDYAYSFGELQPDLVSQIYGGYHNPDTLFYLANYTKVYLDDFPIYVRNGSPEILWDHVPPGEPAFTK